MAEFEFTYHDHVRYSDCDMHGHMNNARYLSFMEQARIGYLEAIGMPPSSRRESIPFILVHASCDYRLPAVLNDRIATAIRTTRFGRTSCTMLYRMTRATDGAVFAEGKTVFVMFDYATERPATITSDLQARIWRLQEATGVARAEVAA